MARSFERVASRVCAALTSCGSRARAGSRASPPRVAQEPMVHQARLPRHLRGAVRPGAVLGRQVGQGRAGVQVPRVQLHVPRDRVRPANGVRRVEDDAHHLPRREQGPGLPARDQLLQGSRLLQRCARARAISSRARASAAQGASLTWARGAPPPRTAASTRGSGALRFALLAVGVLSVVLSVLNGL